MITYRRHYCSDAAFLTTSLHISLFTALRTTFLIVVLVHSIIRSEHLLGERHLGLVTSTLPYLFHQPNSYTSLKIVVVRNANDLFSVTILYASYT